MVYSKEKHITMLQHQRQPKRLLIQASLDLRVINGNLKSLHGISNQQNHKQKPLVLEIEVKLLLNLKQTLLLSLMRV
ncbi:MAG: hypothetical protein GX383_09665 [Clostridium sp.]|nr:hypothetical protein [Clostridium sp.]